MLTVVSTSRRSTVSVFAMIVAVGMLLLAVGNALRSHERTVDTLDRRLASEARRQAQSVDAYFARARSLALITAHNPAFRDFYSNPAPRERKIAIGDPTVAKSNEALAYLERLFPRSIGEVCFIDRGGAENARAVKGSIEPVSALSADESANPFFAPSFGLGSANDVYQSAPYRSPDTQEWVIANSALVPTRSKLKPAIIHFELTIESFRREAAATSGGFDVAIVDAKSGAVIADTRLPQLAGERSVLGSPRDRRFASLRSSAESTGRIQGATRPAAYRRIDTTSHNANDWYVVTSSRVAAAGWASGFGPIELATIAIALMLMGLAITVFRTSRAGLQTAALTDHLTGLANRRRLSDDLERVISRVDKDREYILALYDLDGFKGYNDNFGHPAGDALLIRLASALTTAVNGRGRAYRMGGDEFCVLAPDADDRDQFLDRISNALTETGERFSIGASFGVVCLPSETNDADEAMRLADQRLYAHKRSGRASVARQTTQVLMGVLSERDPTLRAHVDGVKELAEKVAIALKLSAADVACVARAAALHDIGKVAIPDAILNKPGPLNDEEWVFMRQHTLIGERIVAEAPVLDDAARLVRWSHERIDGTGYPDGLVGDEIPIGARIVAVCDAFDAMTSPRPYRTTPMTPEQAIGELNRTSGTQFDVRVVEVFCEVIGREALADERKRLEA